MLRGVLFQNEKFDEVDENNLLCPFTENTIILCQTPSIMEHLSEEIVNTVNGIVDVNEYDCDDEDCGNAKYGIDLGMHKVVQINGQTVTLCLEPAVVYNAHQLGDIWFAEYRNREGAQKISVYPLSIYKGAKDIWNAGIRRVYLSIVTGKVGCYTGEWTNLTYRGDDDA